MNFNLDATKVFRILKNNFKGIARYTLAIMLCSFGIMFSLFLNVLLYKNNLVHYSYPLIISLLIAVLSFAAVIYFIGFNCEVIHNLIEEKDDFMPLAKGRFKEFMSKGVKAFLYSILCCCIAFVLFMAVAALGIFSFVPDNLTVVLASLSLILTLMFFTPFFMAYAYTFDVKALFDKKNITIFTYSYPEFIYSYVLSKLFNFAVSILFVLALVCVLLISYIFVFVISLIGKALLTGAVAAIFVGVVVIAGVFTAFLINTITSIYMFSLNAQSYNYGKYFFYKGEAPKRKPVEIILPLVLLILMCALGLYADKLSDNFKGFVNQNRGGIYNSIQNLSK